MDPAIAHVVKDVMSEVVNGGTAKRVKGVYKDVAGNLLPIGGKTGTGDNRFESFGPGHQLVEDRPVDRTATFVFFLGDHLYGTVTAFVPGAQAENYHFTSSLVVLLLTKLVPELQALIEKPKDASMAKAQLVTK